MHVPSFELAVIMHTMDTHKGLHPRLTNNKEGLPDCVEHSRQVGLIKIHKVDDQGAAQHRHVQTYAVLPTQEQTFQ